MKYQRQLKSIIKASDWSQEQLARELGVSFATLNSWINARSVPRAKSKAKIDNMYIKIVGSEKVDLEKWAKIKKSALSLRTTAEKISSNKDLTDKLTLFLTYHTNTIEGSTMTLADVGNVIFDNKVLSNRTAIEQAEARNHKATLHWLLDEILNKGDRFEVNKDLILDIHLRLMNGIISNAGSFRTHSVKISGTSVVLADWVDIPYLLDILFEDMKEQTGDLIDVLAESHARFEQIHPFSDGNGRTGRLVMLAQSLQAGYFPPLVVKERKNTYYKYLELAQTRNEYKPLSQFIAESVCFTGDLLNSKQTQ